MITDKEKTVLVYLFCVLSGALPHHAMQAQQQPVMQQPTGVAPTPPAQAQAQQSKEFNTASLCRIGQETVHDIVSRTQEVFQTLKIIQVPMECLLVFVANEFLFLCCNSLMVLHNHPIRVMRKKQRCKNNCAQYAFCLNVYV